MARINLLPWRQEERETRRREFFYVTGGACGLAFLVVFLAHLGVSHFETKQQLRNQLMSQEVTRLNESLREIAGLKNKKDEIIARVKIIQTLQAGRPLVVRLFDQLVDIIPHGVYLTSIKRQGSHVYVEGMAESNTRISKLMRNVDGSSWLKNAKLSEIKTRSPLFFGTETKAFKLQFSERPYEGDTLS